MLILVFLFALSLHVKTCRFTVIVRDEFFLLSVALVVQVLSLSHVVLLINREWKSKYGFVLVALIYVTLKEQP